ncbi:hypothetical protein Lal_00012780 [Lupinus albus]|nr:hypothetical protein Lal_00012780 [Lupinus albus]
MVLDRMRFSALIWLISLIVITASDICASYQPCQHNLQAIFITAVTFDVEFVIIKKGEIESVQCQEEHFGKLSLYVLVLMRTTCANKSLKIINKSTCLSLPIVKKNLPNQPGGLDTAPIENPFVDPPTQQVFVFLAESSSSASIPINQMIMDELFSL